MLKSLLKSAEFDRVSNPVGSGTGTTNSDGVDMKGFDAVTFLVAISAIASSGTVTLHLEQSDDNGVADGWSDLEGSTPTAYGDTDDNKICVVEVSKPTKRYVRLVTIRASGNSTIDGAFAIKTRPGEEPVTQGADVVSSKLLVSPDEGTP